MSAVEILATLHRAGLRVEIAGEHLAVSPRKRITAELRAPIRDRKSEILDALADDRRHCATCRNLSGTCCGARKVPVIDFLPRRCIDYRSASDDPDQRLGRERWPVPMLSQEASK